VRSEVIDDEIWQQVAGQIFVMSSRTAIRPERSFSGYEVKGFF
jgi:hypothetical protein